MSRQRNHPRIAWERRLILERTQKRMAGVGQLFNHRKGFQTVHGGRCLDQARCRHQFYFARQFRSADFEKSIRLIVRSIKELMDHIQIHPYSATASQPHL